MEAVRTYETSVDNYFTRQYIPEDNCERLTTIFIPYLSSNSCNYVKTETHQAKDSFQYSGNKIMK
jgi:hypothetical protein